MDNSDSRLVLKKISEIIKNEKEMSDLDIANAINEIKSDGVHIISPRLEKFLESRVNDFCTKNGFKLDDYEGVLPWRKSKTR